MNPWRDLRKLPGHVWLVCAADFINRAGTMALVFLVPSLTLDRHWTLGQASLAMSVYGGSRMVCGFVTGTIIDRVGAVRVLNVSLVGVGLSLVALPFVSAQVSVFCAAGAVGGIRASDRAVVHGPPGGARAADKRRAVFALQRLGANLGMSIGPRSAAFLPTCSTTGCSGAMVQPRSRLRCSSRRSSGPCSAMRSRRRRVPGSAEARGPILGCSISCSAFLPVLLVFFQTEGTMSLWWWAS